MEVAAHGKQLYSSIIQCQTCSTLNRQGRDARILCMLELPVRTHLELPPFCTRRDAPCFPKPQVQMRPKMHRNLDEIYAGLCDGMTYEECDLRSKAKQPTHAMLVRSDPIDPRDACEIRPNLIRDL